MTLFSGNQKQHFFFIISGVRYTGTTDLHLPPFYFEETHKVQEAVASDKFKSDIICWPLLTPV